MKKKTQTFNTKVYHRQDLRQAADELKAGNLVAFPTETVYGLGAIANNEEAVASVFETKGRPQDNPLIVHVPSIESVSQYVSYISPIAQVLMEAFWPGPLTIIFPVEEGVFAKNVSASLPTVGMRMPRQLETLLTIEMAGFPIVGPSANLSGKPSPTSVDHVLHDFKGHISGVIAHSQPLTDIGVESTVVLPGDDRVSILRPGAITKDMLAEVVDVPVEEMSAKKQNKGGQKVMSPGVKYQHYSPKQPVYLIQSLRSLKEWEEIIGHFNQPVGLLADSKVIGALGDLDQVVASHSLGDKGNIQSATHQLFAGLRYLEDTDCEIILAQGLEDLPQAHAYMNRLSKAANYVL